MSTWQARYVRLADRARDLERVRAHVSRVHSGTPLVEDAASPFVGWLVPRSADAESPQEPQEPQDLSDLSRDFGEAIGLAVHTVADLVIYDHFVAGAPTRGLTYAGEAGWVRVVGEREPWESSALFSQATLEELLSALDDELIGDALARDRAELERLWSVRDLVEGAAHPPVAPLHLTSAIEKHFALPTLRPAPSRRTSAAQSKPRQ